MVYCNNFNFKNNNKLIKNFTTSFCVASGGPRILIGQSTFIQIYVPFNISKSLSSSNSAFRFSFKVFQSLGKSIFLLTTPSPINIYHFISRLSDTSNDWKSMFPLIVLNVLGGNALMTDNFPNKLAQITQVTKNCTTFHI